MWKRNECGERERKWPLYAFHTMIFGYILCCSILIAYMLKSMEWHRQICSICAKLQCDSLLRTNIFDKIFVLFRVFCMVCYINTSYYNIYAAQFKRQTEDDKEQAKNK